MQIDSTLQKLEVPIVAAVAVILVSALAFAVSAPFSADDYAVPDAATTACRQRARHRMTHSLRCSNPRCAALTVFRITVKHF